jgi:hypothetical protein
MIKISLIEEKIFPRHELIKRIMLQGYSLDIKK